MWFYLFQRGGGGITDMIIGKLLGTPRIDLLTGEHGMTGLIM
jgi:hypothetical protein